MKTYQNFFGKNSKNFIFIKKILFIILFTAFSFECFAKEHFIDLNIDYKTVNFSGRSIRKAIAVNNQIPAPTLRLKQGDHVVINVRNNLDKGTAVHWHGVLVPWQMDGVEGITQKAIAPGCAFRYEFTLEQSGTYWYHAHAGTQEQDGFYGAFIIEPSEHPKYSYTKDYVIVLSDWSNAKGEQVLANLKKEGDYYSQRFPLQPSLMRFVHDYRNADLEERKNIIDDYKMMQRMRMSIYDLSDVAYDAYLLNGQPKSCPWTAPVRVGDIVRLRFIGAAGSTIYRVKIPGEKMQMVHVDGNDVEPHLIDDFSIAPGETYDVLVKIRKNMPYIIYAESIDTLGKAYGALVTDSEKCIAFDEVVPFPEPEPVTRTMMSNMMMSGMDHGSMAGMNHGAMPGMDDGAMKHDTNKGMDHSSMKDSMVKAMDHESMNAMDHVSIKKNKSSTKSEDMNMSSYSMSMNAATSHHDMQSMSTKKISNHENLTAHTSNPIKTEKPSSHTKQSMDMPGMDHGSMKMPDADHASMKMGGSSKMDHGKGMNHSMHMDMPLEPTIIGDTIAKPNSTQTITKGTKYQNLIAAVETNNPNKPVAGVIKMELFGYMERFIWFINGLPEHKAKPISIEPGKRYRIIFTNNSMMRHPMHIHGHWFILRKGNGSYDPLLHTIEVAPGETIVADFDSDASGQWFFHCHHLYHMMTGMARVFQYKTIIEVVNGTKKPENLIEQQQYPNRPIVRVDEILPIDHSLVHHPMAHPPGLYLANFLDVGEDPFHNVQKLNFKGLYGGDYNKLQLFINDASVKKGKIEDADLDIFYWRLISQFWAIKAGVNYFYRPGGPYWQPGVGIEGLMPYFIDTNIRAYYYRESLKLDAELTRDSQITNNFFIRAGVRSILATKTVVKNEIGSGLNQMRYIIRPFYRIAPGINLFIEYEHEQEYGALKGILKRLGKSTKEDTVTFGVGVLF